MAKHKPIVKIKSYGIYSQWQEKTKELPKLLEATTDIPAREDIEFGFIANIKSAKNARFEYRIAHPDIPDDQGNPRPPFTGEFYVKNNDMDFFLGDTLWLPLQDKLGHWHLSLSHDGKVLAEKTFFIDIEIHGERTIGTARSAFKPKKRW